MAKGKGFGGQPFVAAQAFPIDQERSQAAGLQFLTEWRKDPTVTVRTFKRYVRGGGTAVQVTLIVVRRKVAKPIPPADEWVIVGDRDSGLTIDASGFLTGGEAGAVRRVMEANLAEDDTVNYLLLTRTQAEAMIKEDRAKGTNEPGAGDRVE